MRDSWKLLDEAAEVVAPRLLGCIVERQLGATLVRAKIVETEAYDQTDAASHSYHGQTPRTDVMFGPSGHLYVYFTYGMHYCMNVVCEPAGYGAAVLIRALEPVTGEHIMAENRHGRGGVAVSNGPAKLCQALRVDKALSGHNLQQAPLKLVLQPPLAVDKIIQTTRIGITRAADQPWRFYVKGNPYVSRP